MDFALTMIKVIDSAETGTDATDWIKKSDSQMRAVEKKAKPSPTSEHCTFILLPQHRTHPAKADELTGFYKGKCRIMRASFTFPGVATAVTIVMKCAISLCSAHVYHVEGTGVSFEQGKLEIGNTEMLSVERTKDMLEPEDVACLVDELKANSKTKLIGAKLSKLKKKQLNLERDILAPLGDARILLEDHSDVLRLPHLLLLARFLRNERGVLIEEQLKRLRSLTYVQLEALVEMLKTEPWELVFRNPLHDEFAKVKPMLVDPWFMRACADFAISVPEHIEYALRVYAAYRRDEADRNHTLHNWLTHSVHIIPIQVRRAVEPQVKAFLSEKALDWIGDDGMFAFKEHARYARTVCKQLIRYHENATHTVPVVRQPTQVPVLPPILTPAQTRIAQCILVRCVTIVEGLPGTGKTALITWAMSHFENVLLCTLTGMMTKSLQTRCGKRTEAAHTIHSVLYAATEGSAQDVARAWLAKFQVLIIDEFSNTTMAVFSRLLKVLPNLCRVILVGDYEQIRSMKPGDPMGDARGFFGTQRLTEILRVKPHLRELSLAPKHIVEGRVRDIGFSPTGPISLIEKPLGDAPDYTTTLRPIILDALRRHRSLMSHHIVVLQNSVRKQINLACQAIHRSPMSGMIDPSASTYKIGYVYEYCVGSKITFSKNYNKPISVTLGKDNVVTSDPVANGELGVIVSITQFNKGFILKITDNDDPNDGEQNGTVKTVVCSRTIKGAVDYMHLELGYATTSTKVQGKEFACAVFWNNTNPWHVWTRSHAYVAVSRGKERVWVLSSKADFEKICSNKDQSRRTVLYKLLQTPGGAGEHMCKLSKHILPVTEGVRDVSQLVLMAMHNACVPTMEEAVEEEEKKKGK